MITYKRGEFTFYANGRIVDSQANETAFLKLMQECQKIEDTGSPDRATLICEKMIERGFLDPASWRDDP